MLLVGSLTLFGQEAPPEDSEYNVEIPVSEMRNALWYRAAWEIESQANADLEEVVAEYDQLLTESDQQLVATDKAKRIWRTVALVGGAIVLVDFIVDAFHLYLWNIYVRIERAQ